MPVSEAERVGLELSLNIQSGWNLGGPIVTPERAAKLVTWSQTAISVRARWRRYCRNLPDGTASLATSPWWRIGTPAKDSDHEVYRGLAPDRVGALGPVTLTAQETHP